MIEPKHNPRNPLKQFAAWLQKETGARNIGILGAADFLEVARLMRELSQTPLTRAEFIEAFKERMAEVKSISPEG